ncbi:hypothetical protein ASD65_05830 [Microbacterium sp. Root61]|uniref:MFS transporter n=1 Tax=Microbacterium sp. Root61 TaxID=1736570 RepID=UPI0006F68521|nr:MFS transporter [Microbacterium sp. Root61]KRA23993.1 hypothetical protein ASD65_05830 [Microbacterium sp. Root61]
MSREKNQVTAWGIPGFRQLTAAWVFTNLGDSALFLMAAVWVKDLTGSDAAAAAVFIALGLPAILAPFLGMLADRFSRKRLLIIANILIVPIVLALLLVQPLDAVWLVYVVIFLYGCIGYLTAAAQSGLIRDMIEDDRLASANGVLTTIDQGFRLISPLIGTALYVFAGPSAVIALTAVSFAVTAMLMSRVRVVESPHEKPTEGSHYWRDLGAGFTHLFRTPVLNRLTLAMAIAFGAIGLINVTVFPTLEQGLNVPAATLGVIVPLQGVGALIGGVLSARIVRGIGEGRAVGLGMVLMAIGCLPTAWNSIVLVAVGMALVGFSIPIIVVGFATLRQKATPASLQGRTSAASNVAVNVPQTIATIVGAAIIAAVDYRVLIYLTFAVVLCAGVFAATGRRPVAATVDEVVAD